MTLNNIFEILKQYGQILLITFLIIVGLVSIIYIIAEGKEMIDGFWKAIYKDRR